MALDKRSVDTTAPSRDQRARLTPSRVPPWLALPWRVRQSLERHNLPLVAAGVAFYAFLSLFPAITAALSLYGLLADPAALEEELHGVAEYLPEQAQPVVQGQLRRIAAGGRTSLTWGVVISIVGALYLASRGTKGMIRGVHIAYDQTERRSYLRLQVLSLGLTLGGIVGLALAITLIAVLPPLLTFLHLEALATFVNWARWPLLALLVPTAMAVLYHFGPVQRQVGWRWLSWGSGLATMVWLAASGLFSMYVSNFGRYNETYGSIGGVIVLLLWLQISAYVVLLGAALNAELERRTCS